MSRLNLRVGNYFIQLVKWKGQSAKDVGRRPFNIIRVMRLIRGGQTAEKSPLLSWLQRDKKRERNIVPLPSFLVSGQFENPIRDLLTNKLDLMSPPTRKDE
jgi:hypothetical protein